MSMISRLDSRFSDPAAARHTLGRGRSARWTEAELYWLTTVRADGRPHVTPLIGLLADGAVHFSTGIGEQKARNLAHSNRVALTTGTNTWARGLDVIVEGLRRPGRGRRGRCAPWPTAMSRSTARCGGSRSPTAHSATATGSDPAHVFRIKPSKVMAFAKDPHAQTTYRFSGS